MWYEEKSILQFKNRRAIMASRALKIDPKKATTSDPIFSRVAPNQLKKA